MNRAISQQYRKFLDQGGIYEIPPNILAEWMEAINKAQLLDPQNSVHPISKGIYLFLNGDIDGAIRAEKRAEQLAPKAVSAPNFSLAFLYNFKGNLRLSRNQYSAGLAKKTSYEEDMIFQCITFIRQTIKRYPEKKQLKLRLLRNTS